MRGLVALTLSVAAVASAQPRPSPITAAAIGTPVAVTPLRDGALPPAEADRIERALIAALDGTSGLRVANAKLGKLTAPKRGSTEARFAEDPVARALALGGEWKSPLALAVDAAALGEGTVLYLQGVDAAKGKPIASTALSLRGAGEVDRTALQGALVRVLAPERYAGTLVVKVDVAGAQLLVDGVASPSERSLPVGTHTLRVTHPAYRDFLRFVTVEFGRTERVDVALSKYPVDEGELRERERARAARGGYQLAWYQRWYTVGAFAVVLAVASGILAYGIAHDAVKSDVALSCCKLP